MNSKFSKAVRERSEDFLKVDQKCPIGNNLPTTVEWTGLVNDKF